MLRVTAHGWQRSIAAWLPLPVIVASALPTATVMPMTARAAVDIPGHMVNVWHTRDGAPADIGALAQTPDQWIWLGTSSGLFRFDGRLFYAHDLIPDTVSGPRNISSLAVDGRGGLWAVHGSRLAVHRALDGVVTTPPGLPDSNVGGIFFDASGMPMVSVDARLFALVDGRWVDRPAPAWTLPEERVSEAFVDEYRAL